MIYAISLHYHFYTILKVTSPSEMEFQISSISNNEFRDNELTEKSANEIGRKWMLIL
jgi:hypothetical protein